MHFDGIALALCPPFIIVVEQEIPASKSVISCTFNILLAISAIAFLPDEKSLPACEDTPVTSSCTPIRPLLPTHIALSIKPVSILKAQSPPLASAIIISGAFEPIWFASSSPANITFIGLSLYPI